jgi:hypothetical protein
MTNRLQWDVFVSAQIPVVTGNLPPGANEMRWSPISSTLISGKRDMSDMILRFMERDRPG